MNPKIIVALDFACEQQALQLSEQLDPSLCRLKVGKELFTCAGPRLVEHLCSQGFAVFLDLKFHDIPNTVAAACRSAVDLGVWMLNVHASGGQAMLKTAREAVPRNGPLLIAVTVLTSFNQTDLNAIGIDNTVEKQVLQLAHIAQSNGLDGVVCSAKEAAALRRACGSDFCLVTPGIRPATATQDDQQRTMTPAAACAAGADYLVIGRPITKAANPLQSLQTIDSEINQLC